MPSPESRDIRQWLLQNEKAGPSPSSLEETRAGYEERAAKAALLPGTEFEPVVAGRVPCEWVTAPGVAADRVILHLHGGGYTMGSCRTARILAPRLGAASGSRVLTVDYRLAPEHPFPAAVQDAVSAYRWLLESGYPPEKIAIAGDSAGGGLALAALVLLRDETVQLPSAGVLISPWTDVALTGDSMKGRAEADPRVTEAELRRHAELYTGNIDPEHPLVSPLHADLQGLPPLLIHVGTDEILLDDSTRLAERARDAGGDVTLKVWDGVWHVWHSFTPHLPEACEAMEDIGRFVRGRLG
jgi:epsilon-lactone hydrolase